MWIFSTLLVKTRNIFFYSIDVLHIILRDFQGLYLPYVPLGQQGLGGRFRAFIWFIFHYMCTRFSFFVREFQRLFLLQVSPFFVREFQRHYLLPVSPSPSSSYSSRFQNHPLRSFWGVAGRGPPFPVVSLRDDICLTGSCRRDLVGVPERRNLYLYKNVASSLALTSILTLFLKYFLCK